ncbi:hypothetical protein ACO2Q0_05550 [Phenylobacterium sp. VNQ135]|uniref:hypothetical protein n=1 Tax=Phenylobacterium sp. VNQ135 TaxID=3400922 RepID=UPI003C04D1EB
MGAAAVVAPSAAHADAVNLYFERTVLQAADERCKLLAPEVGAALAAGAAQARGAALRQGMAERAVKSLETRARVRAADLNCSSTQLIQAAREIEVAYRGFSRITRMTYPGDQSAWRADRTLAREAKWRLAQDVRFGRDQMTFGLAGKATPGALLAVAQFADRAQPYGARLVLRDTRRTLGPYLPSGAKTLASRLPPASAVQAYLAEARSPAGEDLLPKDARSGWAFRFPAEAVRALSNLDPREAVAVQFLFPGDRVRTAYIEVGDFAAGRAFVQMAAR